MRNLLSFLALIISVAGLGISLTREEIRCWVGLPSNACQSSRPFQLPVVAPQSSPTLRQDTDSREVIRESSPPATAVKTIDKTTEANSKPPESTVPETKPSPAAEKQNSEVVPTVAKESAPTTTPSQEASQPIEVIPPPNESSQPIQVTPPAASN